MEGVVFSGAEQASLEDKQEGPELRNSNHLEKRPKGRPYSLTEEKTEALYNLYYTTSFSLRKIADILGVSRMTVWRAVQDAHMMNMTN